MNDRIGRSSLVLASGTIVSRILGFISAVLLARILGVFGAGADAFALANQLPNNVYVLVAGGVLSSVLVPQIIKAGLHNDGGTAYINRLLTLAGVVVGFITIVSIVSAPLLVRLYTNQSTTNGGFGEENVSLATAFALWCLPQIFFYAIYSVVGEVLNARGVFGPFTWTPALNNVVVIAGMIWFSTNFEGNVASAGDWSQLDIAILAGTATLGVVVQAVALFLFLGRAGISYRPDFRFRGVGLGNTTRLTAWTFGMLLVTQLAGIVQSNIASIATATNDPGLAVLRFGWLVFMLPHSVITVSLGTTYFTRISKAVVAKRLDSVREDLRKSILSISMFMAVSSVLLWLNSGYVGVIFGDSSLSGISPVVSLYAVCLVAFGIIFITQRVLYAFEDTRSPFYLQLLQSAVFVFGIIFFSAGPAANIATGIAAWLSITTIIQALLILFVLRKRLGKLGGRLLLISFLKFVIALLPAAAIGLALKSALDAWGTSGPIEAIVSAGIVATSVVIAYFPVLILLRESSAIDLIKPFRRISPTRD